MARCTSFVTTTSAVTAVLLPSASVFLGISASAAKNAAAYYIKFFWEGTGSAPPTTVGGSQSTTTPIAGTNLPQLSIYIPTTGIVEVQSCPVNNGGRIWYWYSTNPALADTTVLATAGDVVTLIYD